MTEVRPIWQHEFSDRDALFLDANVWLSVYGPSTRKHAKTTAYPSAWKKIRESRSTVFLDVLTLSEFINAYARWEQKQMGPEAMRFKNFRRTDTFREIARDIESAAKRIVRACQPCGSCFDEADLGAVLSQYGEGDRDFNDQMITEICTREDLTLVTHDLDFSDSELCILTANGRLLGR